jgi:hypothetical protein
MRKIISHLRENWIRYGFETMVVMIGILGAYSLNNWNENRKKSDRIELYLEALVEDLTDDVGHLEGTRDVNIFRQRSLDYLLAISGNEGLNFENSYTFDYLDSIRITSRSIPEEYWGRMPDTLDVRLFNLAFQFSKRPSYVDYNSTSYQELQNTGLFSMIKDYQIKNAIDEYYGTLNFWFSDMREQNTQSVIISWRKYLIDEVGIFIHDVDYDLNGHDILENKQTLLKIRELAYLARNRAARANQVRIQGQELIKLIDTRMQTSN